MVSGRTWHERKRERSIMYWRLHGVKLDACTACSGSGHYDSHGSPACGACEGTGKVRGRLDSVERATRSVDGVVQRKRNLIEIDRARREGRQPVLHHEKISNNKN
ncbi:hypothetical protein G6L37_00580 [Agrobacterium rubi]|nr:hypothetical protein [Agrobacterium rubi]NTF23885.1 hypothetical protein [Agrobacterium rubi]